MNHIDFGKIFEQIPLLEGNAPVDFEIKPLTGLTNLNFRLLNAQYDYVLRIPRAQSSETIDRKAEAFNVDRAIELGLAPTLLWRDDSGLSLTRCIARSRALSQSDMRDERLVSQLLDQLAILHKTELVFEGKNNLGPLLNHYLNLLPDDKSAELTSCFRKALGLYHALEQEDHLSVPSHNDLVLDNLLIDQQQRLWIIDWEYSSMSSPYWDMATLCNVGRLTRSESQRLLDQYSKLVFKLDFDLLRHYQYMLQVLTIGWLMAYSSTAIEDEISWLNGLEV